MADGNRENGEKRGEKGRGKERKERGNRGNRGNREEKRRIYADVQSFRTYSPTATDWRISRERLGLERWEYARWKDRTQRYRLGTIVTEK